MEPFGDVLYGSMGAHSNDDDDDDDDEEEDNDDDDDDDDELEIEIELNRMAYGKAGSPESEEGNF